MWSFAKIHITRFYIIAVQSRAMTFSLPPPFKSNRRQRHDGNTPPPSKIKIINARVRTAARTQRGGQSSCKEALLPHSRIRKTVLISVLREMTLFAPPWLRLSVRHRILWTNSWLRVVTARGWSYFCSHRWRCVRQDPQSKDPGVRFPGAPWKNNFRHLEIVFD